MVMREAAVLLAAGVVVGLVARGRSRRGRRRRCCSACSPAIRRRWRWRPAGLGIVAMLASYLPALRASRLEPTEALQGRIVAVSVTAFEVGPCGVAPSASRLVAALSAGLQPIARSTVAERVRS